MIIQAGINVQGSRDKVIVKQFYCTIRTDNFAVSRKVSTKYMSAFNNSGDAIHRSHRKKSN